MAIPGSGPQRGALDWATPATLAAILVATAIGLTIPLIIDASFDDNFTENLATLMLGVVGISDIVVLRFFVLPALSTGVLRQSRSAPVALTYHDIERTAITLVCMFALSKGIYAIMSAIWTDQPFIAVPFGALGLISLAVNMPYARSQLDALYRQRMAEGKV
jgi:hypothetical protein